MTELSHQDDAGTLLMKLAQAQNELTELYEELKIRGGELNITEGRFAETKAKIRVKTQQINTIKILIRAEAATMGGV